MADTESQTQAAPAAATPADRSSNGAPPNGGAPPPSAQETKKMPRFVAPAIIAVVVILGLIFGIPYYNYSKTHEGTDDAYVTGNLVNVSPIISGTVNQLNVDEGDTITKGTLIASLEDSSEQSALRQAQAAYAAAISQVPVARTSLVLQRAQTEAAIASAQAALTAQQAKTSGAGALLQQTQGASYSGLAQARAQFEASLASAAQAAAQRDSALAAYRAQLQAVDTDQHAASAAQSAISAAQANAVKSDNDAKRYAVLVQEDAVTREQYESMQAAAASADSQLTVSQEQYQQAQSQVQQAQASAQQYAATAAAAGSAATAAENQAAAYKANLLTAQANLNNIGVQQGNLLNNSALIEQQKANLQTALAGTSENTIKQQQIVTAQAQAAQAHAELVDAEVQESDTRLYAPTDGEVVRKAVNVGAAVTPGQTIVTISEAGDIWVTANYKETQLEYVRINEPAEVKVDAYPGLIFKGKVVSINMATGASTALLPPDNATGNFTKVVQRVPVKIDLIPDTSGNGKYATADQIANLIQGESVTATIDTSSAQ